MKTFWLLLLFIPFFFSCGKGKRVRSKEIHTVEIENILEDSFLSIRAIALYNNEVLCFAANNNTIGKVDLRSGERVIGQQKYDSLDIQFRSIAFSSSNFYALSVSNPALIFNNHKALVYQENHSKVFYDSMDFWNDQEGIAIGDPTDDCMSIIITRDGGNTWNKLSCDVLPKALEGEAAFAASDTNIAIVGHHTWVATGGKASRVLYSPDKGKTWEVFDTPIVQGKATTGIYSIDFYDEYNGFAIGGDYTRPDDNAANKMRTTDGGKTWELVAQNESPGYRSCIQFIPNSEGEKLIAVGFKGIDYSNNSGSSWKPLSDEGFYTIRFLNDSVAYAAGKGRIAKLTFREE
ncbi:oxidoreductase [Tamlana sp. 2201CG12-4]|uniref:WD40/YVTN/BNR-like repeat-containing protein n=1 Tax=Tamlana sp. 2201CG12-4 TaxID=3112582 RepID=UPI002DB5C394|nr:oxidoreductase [Tamlana sp. 2201CG12-4]MEC3908346.1 oxidoreductase [Tamlana sp. 2201CG12-4]